jgi:hypothetical protein
MTPTRTTGALLILLAVAASAAEPPARDSLSRGGMEFLPGAALVPSPIAHPQEARVGVRKEAGTSRLRLDIGTSMDIIALSPGEGEITVAAGIDFFTYALTTSSEGLRLQVDAVDGFFGGHISLALPQPSAVYELRLRLLHLSAHMVDGHYDIPRQTWKDNRAPLPFTRDFGELLGAVRTRLAGIPCRFYSGFSYATLVRPVSIRRFATLHGLELSSPSLLPRILERDATVYLACHLTLAGIPRYAGTTSLESGVKFGTMYGRGVRVYASYTAGPDVFSQYYDLRTSVWGIGFTFDAW